MRSRCWKSLAALLVTAIVAVSGTAVATALDDTRGREWRQLFDTTGLSWNQVATVCPTDGATPCAGSVGGKDLTGWVWATDTQVLELLSEYAPDLATVNPPQVDGSDYFGQALGFLNVMRWTVFHVTNYSYSEWTGGWTASKNATGEPVGAGAGYGWPPPSGGLGLGPVTDPNEVSPYRGVWLWRTAGLDYSAPVITPVVTGTEGANGWYVSNVSVTWNVQDPESPIDSTNGCDPSTVVADTTGVTFTCQASSFGGTSSASTVVKRDVVQPTVACQSPAPVFKLGQSGAVVSATVADTTSGPAASAISSPANTSSAGQRSVTLMGTDIAGNVTAKQCPYNVVVPPCNGAKPTIIGTAGNDVINGTAARDVILALGGNDTVYGGGGADVICGGDGDDAIEGGNGDDTIDAGAGYDSIRGDAGKDTCISGERRSSGCEIIKA